MFNSKKEPKAVKINSNPKITKKASADVTVPLVIGDVTLILEEFVGTNYPTLYLSQNVGGSMDKKFISLTFNNMQTVAEFAALIRDLVIEVNHQKIDMK